MPRFTITAMFFFVGIAAALLAMKAINGHGSPWLMLIPLIIYSASIGGWFIYARINEDKNL